MKKATRPSTKKSSRPPRHCRACRSSACDRSAPGGRQAMKSLERILALCVVLVAALLAGCATTYTLDSTVQSFGGVPALAQPATYRFERLPSQQDPLQPQLEALADPALDAAGLHRDDAHPRYAVQINARTSPTGSPFADPWGPYGHVGFGGWGWRRHWGMGVG